MTEKQRRFVENYARTANAAEAARAAGYSVNSARAIGNALLTKIDIQQAIEELAQNSSRERIADAEEIRGFWTQIMRDGTEKTADRLSASVSLAKTNGMFVDKSEVKVEEKPRSNVVIYLPEIEHDDEEDE